MGAGVPVGAGVGLGGGKVARVNVGVIVGVGVVSWGVGIATSVGVGGETDLKRGEGRINNMNSSKQITITMPPQNTLRLFINNPRRRSYDFVKHLAYPILSRLGGRVNMDVSVDVLFSYSAHILSIYYI